MTNLLKSKITRFLFIVFSLYIIWFFIYDLLIHPDQRLDLMVIDLTIFLSKNILELLGYVVIVGGRDMKIEGTGGLWIGDSCNGITLFALFAIFIIAYPGNLKKKLFYVPAGIVVIELLNVLRIVLLAILDTYSRAWTEFNHTYTFTIIIYGCIFLMWMFWVEKISDVSLTLKKK